MTTAPPWVVLTEQHGTTVLLLADRTRMGPIHLAHTPALANIRVLCFDLDGPLTWTACDICQLPLGMVQSDRPIHFRVLLDTDDAEHALRVYRKQAALLRAKDRPS